MRRKFIGFILCMTVVLQLVPGAYVAEADGANGIVRVKLSMGAPASVSFYTDGNYSVEGNDAVKLDRQLYTVKLEGSALNLYYGGTLLCGGTSLKLVQHEATAGRNNHIWLKNATYGSLGYLGDMQFSISSGSIAVINHVYIEDYLYGVVPHEMSNAWPVEALKSQAVAARNYVLGSMGSGSYDVVDTSLDQVYKGFNAVNTNAIAAVDQTAKTVLTCGGSLVAIFYSASNGGWTEISQHCWSVTTRLPYQIIQQDIYDVQNPSSLQEWLTFPKDMTGGAKLMYQHSGDTAAVEAPAAADFINARALERVTALGYSSITSVNGYKGIAAKTHMDQHDVTDYTGTNPCIMFKEADITMNVTAKKADGSEETVDIVFTIDMTQLVGPAFVEPMSRLRMLSVEDAGTEWRIYHRRYGHGIGLSQRGAQQRANSPDPAVNTYDKILAFYFPNTALTARDYAKPALTAITTADSSNAAAACPGTTLNIRSGADSSSTANIIGSLPNAARLCVTQANVAAGWHKIVYGGKDAYVSAAYVQIDGGAVIPPPTPTPTPTPTPAPTPTLPPTAKLGDVNGDGAITISDYTLVRLDILGLKKLAGDAIAAADVNRDGAISISDYTLIRLDILGLKKIG